MKSATFRRKIRLCQQMVNAGGGAANVMPSWISGLELYRRATPSPTRFLHP
jgi:hypothetical protein